MVKQKNIALFIDYENVAYNEFFDICVLTAKLKEQGRLIVQKAYADWALLFKKDSNHMFQMSNKAIELIELPVYNATRENSKNFGDIKLVVDALEISFTKPFIDTFVIVSGDGDCSPLISKLREYNKEVIGVGRDNTNKLLPEYCDSFLYYKDLVKEIFEDSIKACEDKDILPTISTIKKIIVERVQPPFDYSDRFKKLLDKAEKEGYVTVEAGLIKIGNGKKIITSPTNGKSMLRKSRNSGVIARKKPKEVALKSVKKVMPTVKVLKKPEKKYYNKELLKLIYWSFVISQKVSPNHKGFDSRVIENNLKRLSPTFKLTDYQPEYTQFEAYISDLVTKCKYLKNVVNKNPKSKNRLFALEDNFSRKGAELPKPDNYAYAFTDSKFIKYKLTINFDSIYVAANKIAEIVANEPKTPMNKVRNRMYKLKNGNRSFYTLLFSKCLFNREGNRINKYQADGIIGSVDTDILELVKGLLNQKVVEIFSEEGQEEEAFDALRAIAEELGKFEENLNEKAIPPLKGSEQTFKKNHKTDSNSKENKKRKIVKDELVAA